jgi:dynactin 1
MSEAESAEISRRTREMYDLNQKLQASALKTQVKTIDLELRKLEAQEALEHLSIVRV